MIYNDNGILLERVCINNTIISFPSFYSFNESSNDKENEILQNIEAIKDEIKECDDKKLKKLEKKAKASFIQKKIADIIAGLQLVLAGIAYVNAPAILVAGSRVIGSGFKFKERKISTTILAIFGSIIALINIITPVSKGLRKSSDKNSDTIKETLKNVIDFFNKTANNSELPKEIRDDAKEKAAKVSDILSNITSINGKLEYYKTDKTINSEEVYVADESNYKLRKNEYDTAIDIYNSKWKKVINNIVKFINDLDIIDPISEKFLYTEDKITISHIKDEYKISITYNYEYEEESGYVVVDLTLNENNFKSKDINLSMRIRGDTKNIVI